MGGSERSGWKPGGTRRGAGGEGSGGKGSGGGESLRQRKSRRRAAAPANHPREQTSTTSVLSHRQRGIAQRCPSTWNATQRPPHLQRGRVGSLAVGVLAVCAALPAAPEQRVKLPRGDEGLGGVAAAQQLPIGIHVAARRQGRRGVVVVGGWRVRRVTMASCLLSLWLLPSHAAPAPEGLKQGTHSSCCNGKHEQVTHGTVRCPVTFLSSSCSAAPEGILSTAARDNRAGEGAMA